MAAIITASEVNRVIQTTQLNQVMDQVNSPAHKWFSLQDNLLDGSFHLIGTTEALQVGWWGAALSNASGYLTSPPTLTITETRSVHALQVVGDSLLNEYPVDFTVKLYNGAALLHTETVVGNNSVIWSKTFSTTYDVTKIDIAVSRINKASRVVKIVDAFSPFNVLRSDELKPKSVDSGAVSLGIESQDTLSVSIINLNVLEVGIASQDDLTITGDDESFFTQYELWKSDTMSVSVAQSKSVEVSTNSSDSLHINDTESTSITALLDRQEALVLNGNVEEELITASFSSSDEVLVKTEDKSYMTNVHTRMNEAYRQTFAKVEITYTDPFLDNTLILNASSTAYGTDVKELADNLDKAAYKWFSLSDNKLDGTSCLIDGSKTLSVGWWSAELSDENGEFSISPRIEVNFEPRALYKLKVAGDEKLNNYPVDFDIFCYDSNNDLVHTESVFGNEDIIWTKDIEILLDIVRLELFINRINKPNDTAKLTEFFTAIVETYYGETIVDLSLLEELSYPSGSVALGAVSTNEIDIVLDNSTGRFNLGNEQSPLYNLIKRNRRVRAWLGTCIIPDEIEWYPLGVFWTIGWDIPDSSLEAKTTARDRLELLRFTDFVHSSVYENYTLGQLFYTVLNDAGLELGTDYLLDDYLSTVVIPYAWFDRMSHRDALQRLAQCAYIQVYCDRDGKIIVGPIDTSPQVYFNFDNDTNIYTKSYPITATEITNYVEVSTNAILEKPLQEVLNIPENITLAPTESIVLTYTFSSFPCKNLQAPVILGAIDLTVTTEMFSWGTTITLTNNQSTNRTITGITMEGQPLEVSTKSFVVAKDDVLIRDNGKLRVTVQHDFIQDTTYANQLAGTLLDAYKQSLLDVSMQTRGNMGLYLGHKIQVNDSKMNTNYQYITQRQTINWNGALSASVDGKKI